MTAYQIGQRPVGLSKLEKPLNLKRPEQLISANRHQLNSAVGRAVLHRICLSGAIFAALTASTALAQQDSGAYVRPSLINGHSTLIKKPSGNSEPSQVSAQRENTPTQTALDNAQRLVDAAKKSQKAKAKKSKTLATKITFPYHVKDWEVDKVIDVSSNSNKCVAKSHTPGSGKASSPTVITLQVDNDTIKVLTDADIDAYQASTGLRIDAKEIAPFDEVFTSTNVSFSLDYDSLTKQMRKGQHADIILGFWPTQAPTGPSQYRVSLAGFSNAMETLKQCNRTILKT